MILGLGSDGCLTKNQSTLRPSEHPPVMGERMSKHLGGIKGCKYKTSSGCHEGDLLNLLVMGVERYILMTINSSYGVEIKTDL